jgi:hypothetical protein
MLKYLGALIPEKIKFRKRIIAAASVVIVYNTIFTSGIKTQNNFSRTNCDMFGTQTWTLSTVLGQEHFEDGIWASLETQNQPTNEGII